jgi:hypothetical protein
LPPLIVEKERLEHVILLLLIGEERDPSEHDILRRVPGTALKRIRVSIRDKQRYS